MINFPPQVIPVNPPVFDPIAYVAEDGMRLEHLSNVERNNANIVRAAFNENQASFQFASDELKNSVPFVLELLNSVFDPEGDGSEVEFVEFAGQDPKNDFAVGMLVVQSRGFWLECLSDNLKANPEIFEAAILSDPAAYEHGSFHLRNNVATAINCIERLADYEILGPPLLSKVPQPVYTNIGFWHTILDMCVAHLPNTDLVDALFENKPVNFENYQDIINLVHNHYPQFNYKVAIQG
jgi:hypothetical protein